MRLLIVIIEGQLYLIGIVGIFVAELALLWWGIWSRRPILGLIAVFATLPLIRTTAGAIRACFVRTGTPQGLPLEQTDSPALHAVVEEIRCAIDAPRVHAISVCGEFTAKAAVVRPAWRFRRRRTLVLGFPVLATLSLPELRAVIAHELAHFSTAYDRFAAWVYRVRAGWLALRRTLDRRQATPVYVYWLLGWYVPRLNAAAAPVSRRHELVADGIAAKLVGSRTAADALVVFESGARFLEDSYWPAIDVSYETEPEPPRPYSQMLTGNARQPSTELLESLVAKDTEAGDTHPSLRERLARLEEPVRMPPSLARSAGHELLGPRFETLARRLDEEWTAGHGGAWHQRRAKYLEQTTTLSRLAAIAAPTPDQLFERAGLVESLHGSDQALPWYQSAAHQGHAAARLAAGRLTLDRMDAAGIALVEAAMDLDERLVPEACQILAGYYRRTHQELAAQKCEWRASRYTTRARLGATG